MKPTPAASTTISGRLLARAKIAYSRSSAARSTSPPRVSRAWSGCGAVRVMVVVVVVAGTGRSWSTTGGAKHPGSKGA